MLAGALADLEEKWRTPEDEGTAVLGEDWLCGSVANLACADPATGRMPQTLNVAFGDPVLTCSGAKL